MSIVFTPETSRANLRGQPIVALESTIITHGMPYPQNVETAFAVEQIVRDNGATPATIAIIDGEMRVGLLPHDIERLGKAGLSVTKASRRDLPFLIATKQLGATTVAATMIIAAKANIQLFATGGIGGVHRNGATTLDISADLQELAQTDVAVVCAGVKSILDIGLTLEYLETLGVPVLGYGTDELPAFYTPRSGFAVDYRLDTPAQIAAVLQAKWYNELHGGVIIGNAIPTEFAMPQAIIDAAIAQALAEADEQGIKGKLITPFLLARIEQITGGNSLAANVALIKNNAAVAAQIACAMCA
jgi:pseudouridylate synthase